MKSFYSHLTKFTFLVLAAFVVQSSKGQTVLSKGDLAFTGYIGNGAVAGTDEFSFVLLRAISAGTVIKFTENGWLRTSPTAGSFRTGEGTLQFTSVALPAGAEIRVVCSATPTATFAGLGGSAGTLSILAAPEGNGTSPAFSANGDQIIAYQGASTSPTFITAIHMNVYSVSPAPGVPGGDAVTTTTTEWDGSFSNAVASGLPSGSGSNFLTNGVDAIWIPGSISAEVDNARFSCAAGPLATIADIRAAVFNASNWTTSDGAPGFTLPTSCNYIGVFLPVQLISFQAKNNLSKVDVQWQVANQQNVSHYEVERSFDNQKFEKIGQVAAQPGTGQLTYDYSDVESLKNSAAIIYYRLKSVDLDGKFSYSDIVNIRNKKSNLVIDNLSNPVKNNLVFTLTSKSGGPVQVQLTDVNGRILATRVMQVTASSTTTVTMPEAAALAQGMYLLKVVKDSETTVARFIK